MEIELPWWRHQMETFSALLALCAGNSPVPVNSPHKNQWRGALMFSLICTRINDWVNNREAGDLRRHRGNYDVIVMTLPLPTGPPYVTVGFPSHIASNVESVSMSWRHQIWRHGVIKYYYLQQVEQFRTLGSIGQIFLFLENPLVVEIPTNI